MSSRVRAANNGSLRTWTHLRTGVLRWLGRLARNRGLVRLVDGLGGLRSDLFVVRGLPRLARVLGHVVCVGRDNEVEGQQQSRRQWIRNLEILWRGRWRPRGKSRVCGETGTSDITRIVLDNPKTLFFIRISFQQSTNVKAFTERSE